MSHPDWCDREFCTAYADDLDRPYHRSRPTEITTDDGDTADYVHAGPTRTTAAGTSRSSSLTFR